METIIHHNLPTGRVLIAHSKAKNPKPSNTKIHVFVDEPASGYQKFYASIKGHKGIRKINTSENFHWALETFKFDFRTDCYLTNRNVN